jgi:hypothetical protein
MATYEMGQVVRATGTFKNAAGDIFDPSVVKFRVRTPAAVVTEYIYGQNADLVKDSTGIYHFDVVLGAAGQWKYRWISTGTGATAKVVTLDVAEVDF